MPLGGRPTSCLRTSPARHSAFGSVDVKKKKITDSSVLFINVIITFSSPVWIACVRGSFSSSNRSGRQFATQQEKNVTSRRIDDPLLGEAADPIPSLSLANADPPSLHFMDRLSPSHESNVNMLFAIVRSGMSLFEVACMFRVSSRSFSLFLSYCWMVQTFFERFGEAASLYISLIRPLCRTNLAHNRKKETTQPMSWLVPW